MQLFLLFSTESSFRLQRGTRQSYGDEEDRGGGRGGGAGGPHRTPHQRGRRPQAEAIPLPVTGIINFTIIYLFFTKPSPIINSPEGGILGSLIDTAGGCGEEA